ncbi:hypothetical protein BRARA_H00012 [Brassica rapa]|uniref:BnaA08g00090D protein n=4 Tax=Brassica TaxID=3705 RepID=A0A078HV66_BRANA|nr:protein unc-45 homolog A [Brassica rapa]RID49198.1 hypothetical protein BRARA_H00012 [Brassica rapa]CDY42405.1 BnaA08g00090D [Brassica napus]VDD02590.1 unnamed protein product [Brassica rapa]
MASAASGKVEKGHQLYRDGKYKEALLFYTEALSAAKSKSQKIALHSNRAACYLKLHDFKQAAEECTWVLELDQKHSGALMLRAQTLVTLKDYHSALFDVTRLLDLNPDSDVYQNLEARLRTQLSLAPIPESEAELEDEDEAQQDTDEQSTRKDESRFESLVSITRDVRNKGEEIVAPKTPEVREDKSKENGSLSNAWQAIPKPKGHSTLDYARWNTVQNDDSSEDDDSDEDSDEDDQPQYRFRVRTVGVRPVK